VLQLPPVMISHIVVVVVASSYHAVVRFLPPLFFVALRCYDVHFVTAS